MTLEEVRSARLPDDFNKPIRILSSASDSVQVRFLQLKVYYEALVRENDALRNRLKSAKKIIQQKEDEVIALVEERDLLLTRIRENREHFHMLCSPGGIFHGALTPKMQAVSTPQPLRATPRQTPKT